MHPKFPNPKNNKKKYLQNSPGYTGSIKYQDNVDFCRGEYVSAEQSKICLCLCTISLQPSAALSQSEAETRLLLLLFCSSLFTLQSCTHLFCSSTLLSYQPCMTLELCSDPYLRCCKALFCIYCTVYHLMGLCCEIQHQSKLHYTQEVKLYNVYCRVVQCNKCPTMKFSAVLEFIASLRSLA